MLKHTVGNSHYHLLLTEPVDPKDALDKEKALQALAALRHAKWFQVRLLTFLFPPPSFALLMQVFVTILFLLSHNINSWHQKLISICFFIIL